MGQVPAESPVSGPAPYGFVGDGRLSRHWRHYFTSLGIPWKLWSRRLARSNGRPGVAAADALGECPVILLAVSDDAIGPVMARLRAEGLDDRRYVHFCGGRSFEGAFGAHPLMSFGTTLYEPAFYRDIPVFVDRDSSHPEPIAEFRALFPRLPNPCFPLKTDDKPYYHALCALAGGFTAVLWRDFFAAMAARFGAPREALAAYPRRIVENVIASQDGALTGPVARGDAETIQMHLDALDGTALSGMYQAFIAAAGRERA
jgi:2-dehydropantoate 2-reductase